MKCHRRAVLTALLAFLLPAAAPAKVIFTGYAETRLNAHTEFRILGDPAARGALNIADDAQHRTRAFTFENLGLFATTSVAERMDFKVDFTYRQLGPTVGQLRVQYAYFEHAPTETFDYRVGKITLPFNYYNRNRFYPFQRVELQAPFFLNSILGLPIASVGAHAQQRFETAPARFDLDVYAVNGYAGNQTNGNVFRSAVIPGGAAISNNLAAGNNNGSIAGGARFKAARLGGTDTELGISYYGGAWDTGGRKMLQLFGSHLRAKFRDFELLTELLHMDVAGDAGFATSVDDTHWKTSGYLATISKSGATAFGAPLTPYVAAEGYVSEGHNGKGSQEKLQAYRGGAELKPLENISLKAEYSYLYYGLPFRGLGEIRLWAHQALMAFVVTF